MSETATRVPNLDAMDIDELRAWYRAHWNRTRRLGRLLFPDGQVPNYDGQNRTWLAGRLVEYARLRIVVGGLADCGSLDRARCVNREAQAVFEQLPEYARW